ncbi:basic proline-rich protein-like, partial [Penaeus indicus]|uniref:basic proline-rich protein-like n=1 Tax=Penaeus indicus TaxID=29960 RepID=UPI00300BFA8C
MSPHAHSRASTGAHVSSSPLPELLPQQRERDLQEGPLNCCQNRDIFLNVSESISGHGEPKMGETRKTMTAPAHATGPSQSPPDARPPPFPRPCAPAVGVLAGHVPRALPPLPLGGGLGVGHDSLGARPPSWLAAAPPPTPSAAQLTAHPRARSRHSRRRRRRPVKLGLLAAAAAAWCRLVPPLPPCRPPLRPFRRGLGRPRPPPPLPALHLTSSPHSSSLRRAGERRPPTAYQPARAPFAAEPAPRDHPGGRRAQ